MYDYIISAILLGPSNSGKTTLINTYLKKNLSDYATIGVDFHKIQLNHNNNFFQLKLWDTGKGLLYRNIIDSFLKKANIYIIVNNNTSYDFINQVYETIDYNNPKLILFIYNKNHNNDNFKYNESFIQQKNTNILIKFFYINLTKKNEVNLIFDYIKEYTYNLNNNKHNTINQENNFSCCSIS